MSPNLRVLYVSGYTADIIGDRAVLELGDELLAKPFTALSLLAKVRAVLDRELPRPPPGARER